MIWYLGDRDFIGKGYVTYFIRSNVLQKILHA